jgi:hypothetical protein
MSTNCRIPMKLFIFLLYFALALTGLSAQTPLWQPSPGHTQVPIWPGAVPDARPVGHEYAQKVDDVPGGAIVVGKVSQPTMTVYRRRERIQALRSSFFLAEAIGSCSWILKVQRFVTG